MNVSDSALPPTAADPGLPPASSTHSIWHTPSSPLHSHRTTAALPTTADTVIIGSGLAGSTLFTSLPPSLAPPGATLMLEARPTCYGATGRNGGHCKPMLYQESAFAALCAAFGTPEVLTRIRFEQRNLALIRSLCAAFAPGAEFTDCPSADVYYTATGLAQARAAIRALHRAAPEIAAALRVVTAETAEGRRELRDSLRTPAAVGAIVFRAAQLWPYQLVSALLLRGVEERGLNLQTRTPCTGLTKRDGGWTVRTPRGDITARRVFVAANAHAAHVLPQLAGWVYPVRAQCVALSPPRGLRLTHTYGLVRTTRDRADYLIQRPCGTVVLGGGRHLERGHGVGLDDASTNPGVTRYLRQAFADAFDDAADAAGGMRESFIERFRRLSVTAHDIWDPTGERESDGGRDGGREGALPEVTAEWSGTMGFTRDGRPMVGRVPACGWEDAERLGVPEMKDTEGLWMLAGFGGHGMALTAGCAEALVAMVVEDEGREKEGEKKREAQGKAEEEKEGEGLWSWFPKTFEITPERVGLQVVSEEERRGAGRGEAEDGPEEEVEGWVLVDSGEES
ncbi:FAD dependent oxidoreductase-domain-containing protein [Geopyxis carbonaria]|nr:FAD dependent oxidoreductase-domain-containing protein [Geopyxis carbonaria]